MLARIKQHFHHSHYEPPVWLLITAIIFFIAIIGTSISYWVYISNYKDKIFPGVFVGSVNVGGLTQEQAFNRLNEVFDQFNNSGLTVTYKKKKVDIKPTLGDDDSVGTVLIDFDADKSSMRAYNYGREFDFFTNTMHQINTLLSGHIIAPNYAINEAAVQAYLKDALKSDLKAGEDAKIKYVDNKFVPVPERSGFEFNFQPAMKELEALVANLKTGNITLEAIEKKPAILQSDLESLIVEANSKLEISPLLIGYEKKTWKVERSELGNWLLVISEDNKPQLTMNQERVLEYLAKEVAPKVEIKVTDSRFSMKGGKVSAFTTAKNGIAIDATSTLENINNNWFESGLSATTIATTSVQSQSGTSTDAIDLGIKEIIGVGTSNFSGSPANRRHNIRVGLSYLNGLIIPPGQTFSVMRHLGSIDGSKGYLEELVIKKDKTQKEFGGGLCQIGTTVFRAALNTGLPIVERRNHSYRVAYYEPAGTDATLYDPSPDLKFTNDTGNNILIQGYVTGNKVTFEFWGTKDGRKVKQTYPSITSIVKPAPAKLIETLSLKPGVKKCTEKAHNGANASFSYIVDYPSGEKKSRVFSSHYVPWQEVCLIGVSKLSSSTPATTESSANESAGTGTATSTKTKTPSTTEKVTPKTTDVVDPVDVVSNNATSTN